MSAIAYLGTGFVATLTALFASNAMTSEEETAQAIADEYANAIKVGFNVFSGQTANPAMVAPGSPNINAFKEKVLDGMEQSKAAGPAGMLIMAIKLAEAPVAFWTGGSLDGVFKGMPPGHVMLTPPINVLSPGVCLPIVIPPFGALPMVLPMAMSLAYIAHLPTVSFLCTAAILPFPAPPYPLPLVGYL